MAKRRVSCKTLERRFAKAEKKLITFEDRAEKKRASIFFEARTGVLEDLTKRERGTIKRLGTRIKTLRKARNKALDAQVDC